MGDFHYSGFHELKDIAAARLDHKYNAVDNLIDLCFRLSHTDGFYEYNIENSFEDRKTMPGLPGQATEVGPRCHTADKDPFVGRVVGDSNPVSEKGAATFPAARVDGYDADAFAPGAVFRDKPGDKRRFPRTRRSGDADHMTLWSGVPAQFFKKRSCLLDAFRPTGFQMVERFGNRRLLPLEYSFYIYLCFRVFVVDKHNPHEISRSVV